MHLMTPENEPRVDIAVLLVNKQFSSEAMRVFYSNNTFTMYEFDDPVYVLTAGKNIEESGQKKIHHLELSILRFRKRNSALGLLASAWAGLEDGRILRVVFKLQVQNSRLTISFDTFKETVAPLDKLRGLKEVDLTIQTQCKDRAVGSYTVGLPDDCTFETPIEDAYLKDLAERMMLKRQEG